MLPSAGDASTTPRGLLRHQVGVARDAARGEQRLDEPPLPLPLVAVGGEQSAPEHLGEVAERDRVLGEGPLGLRQHLLDLVGVVHDDDPGADRSVLGSEVVRDHVAVLVHAAGQMAEQVAPEVHPVAERAVSGRPGISRALRVGDAEVETVTGVHILRVCRVPDGRSACD